MLAATGATSEALSRALTARNPSNVELRVALAVALIERAHSAVLLGRPPDAHASDRHSAERDYQEAVHSLSALADGHIHGTDLDILTTARESLERLRTAR